MPLNHVEKEIYQVTRLYHKVETENIGQY